MVLLYLFAFYGVCGRGELGKGGGKRKREKKEGKRGSVSSAFAIPRSLTLFAVSTP